MGFRIVAGMKEWAMVFPGQGSQRKGMFSAKGVPAQVIEAAAEASKVLGEDLVAISETDKINNTRNSQPALLAAGVGTYRAWIDAGGPKAMVMAGHSLGEYSALVCAGAIDYSEAVALVRKRAEAMLEAVPSGKGAMCAILGLDAGRVVEICGAMGTGVWAANFNAPGQVVISGYAKQVAQAAGHCKEEGAKRAVNLPVEVPSHCPLMEPAAKALEGELQSLGMHATDVKVLQNSTNEASSSLDQVRKSLVDQLTRPVDWTGCVGKIATLAESIAECGPSGVLYGLNRRIVGKEKCVGLKDAASIGALCA